VDQKDTVFCNLLLDCRIAVSGTELCTVNSGCEGILEHGGDPCAKPALRAT
jgi:hypothetical protein